MIGRMSIGGREPGTVPGETSIDARLFRPLLRGSITIPSRVVLAPINTGYTVRGLPSARLLRFHRERSGPEIGISMVGNVAVNLANRTNDSTAVLGSVRDLPRFAALARAISKRGSLPGIQIASTPANLNPSRNWRAKAITAEAERLRAIVSSFSDRGLRVHLAEFLRSASLAAQAGYSVIQIHAAHGYLLSLLLHPSTNVRRGEFSVDAPWIEQFISVLRHRLEQTLLSLRISALTGLLPVEEDVDWTRQVLNRVASAGVDIVDLSAGFYTIDRRLIYPSGEWTQPVYMQWIPQLTRDLPCLIAIAGRVNAMLALPNTLPDNILLAFGRALIADPRFVEKLHTGATAAINQCTLRNRCHYFSRGLPALECGVNPNL